jgi:hypothetical protein
MAIKKGAASTHPEHGEGGRDFEHTGEPLNSSLKPNRAEYQPVTVAEWVRNKREVNRVRFDRYNGRDIVDLRTWYLDEIRDLRPTRKGITLAPQHLPVLAAAVNQAPPTSRIRISLNYPNAVAVIKLSSKQFGDSHPVPHFEIVAWLNDEPGSSPVPRPLPLHPKAEQKGPKPQDASAESAEVNDDIPF